MREIKFRAWVDSNNEGAVMMYCNQNSLCNMTANVSLKSCGDNPPQGHLEYLYKSGYSVMQYTGLKDKNGIDIYEGDILLEENKGEIRAINKPRQNSIVVFKDDGWKRDTYNGSLNVFPPINVRGMEIIGNIYENPELLK